MPTAASSSAPSPLGPIIGELKRHFRDKGWAIRAPRRIQELYLALGPSIESLTQRLGRPPTVAEIAGTSRCQRGVRARGYGSRPALSDHIDRCA